MFEKLDITGTYEPDSTLQTQLEELPDMGELAVVQTEQIDLLNNESALQVVSKGIFAGELVTKVDAEPPFGVISGYHGDLGLAAAMILADSLQFGEPTVAYEIYSESGREESIYPQLSAEWHHHAPAGNGSISQPTCVDTEEVSLEALEARAERWFDSH